MEAILRVLELILEQIGLIHMANMYEQIIKYFFTYNYDLPLCRRRGRWSNSFVNSKIDVTMSLKKSMDSGH